MDRKEGLGPFVKAILGPRGLCFAHHGGQEMEGSLGSDLSLAKPKGDLLQQCGERERSQPMLCY